MKFLLILATAVALAQDLDRDSLPDSLEQRLAERFRPQFLVNPNDCGGVPARFQPGNPVPTVTAKDATIYFRVFPSGPNLEIQYFHLWATDCGRFGHPLDAEHVSALLVPDGDDDWRARYWYSTAHHDTVCQNANAAKATILKAETAGPPVWISAGKHGSFLGQSLCQWGCGGDNCSRAQPLPRGELINLGEPGIPLNGSLWIDDPGWALAAKLTTDFDDALQLRLASTDSIVPLDLARQPVQAVVLAGEKTISGIETGRKETKGSVKKAYQKVRTWFSKRLN